jgi:hypothetical protein
MMISEQLTRRLLIEACHSSEEAAQRILAELPSSEFVALLVQIAVDAGDYQGDAPMRAAYYLSLASPALMKPHESELLDLLSTADGYAGSVALALGRMRSVAAKPVIAQMLAQGYWPADAYRKALSCYAET